MSDLLEKSLDEIISAKSSSNRNRSPKRGPRRSGGRSEARRGRRFSDSRQTSTIRFRRDGSGDYYRPSSSSSRSPPPRYRSSSDRSNRYSSHSRSSPVSPEIIRLANGQPFVKIENLSDALTEHDISDLFSRIGEVNFCRIEFDTRGRSQGVGYVGYVNPSDCASAIEQFDGKKAVGNIISVTNGIPLADRIGLGVGGNRGRGSRRGDRERREPKPPKPTLEDLDAELDNYRNQKDTAMEEVKEP
ncbi:hypothetical protein DASC09_021630 [Saccharomycopsis crataegensis]|uniref:RRM domain-containing protein n=1 Tax=Saccharomycopsis crataegensis TaxID=43959 RepID=A0AAV5QJ85_9ASCO|nr:hypothetical protein DASC09_021630 [Saccharomycopsis crataegensis]